MSTWTGISENKLRSLNVQTFGSLLCECTSAIIALEYFVIVRTPRSSLTTDSFSCGSAAIYRFSRFLGRRSFRSIRKLSILNSPLWHCVVLMLQIFRSQRSQSLSSGFFQSGYCVSLNKSCKGTTKPMPTLRCRSFISTKTGITHDLEDCEGYFSEMKNQNDFSRLEFD